MEQINKTWQQELTEGFSHIQQLCDYLEITDEQSSILAGQPEFPLRVPLEFVQRMEKGNINDPLLLQVLPVKAELNKIAGYSHDPVGDIDAIAETGVIHKYNGRVLLITTGGCAINCRYCFRRNFPYSEFQLSANKQQQAIHYIQQNHSISEVILSGGDPLLLSDNKLFNLLKIIARVDHVKRIRIHSRIPIVLPSRISSTFSGFFNSLQKPCVLVIHANHQNELNEKVRRACEKLKTGNTTLFNQSVLLKNINDNAHQLCALSEKLFEFGVQPYYLHLLDKATGTSHFEVGRETAINIINEVKTRLPGYLVPKLVWEQAGAANKISIT